MRAGPQRLCKVPERLDMFTAPQIRANIKVPKMLDQGIDKIQEEINEDAWRSQGEVVRIYKMDVSYSKVQNRDRNRDTTWA